MLIVLTLEEAVVVKVVLVESVVRLGDIGVSDGKIELVIVKRIVLPLSDKLPPTPDGRTSAGEVKVPPLITANSINGMVVPTWAVAGKLLTTKVNVLSVAGQTSVLTTIAA